MLPEEAERQKRIFASRDRLTERLLGLISATNQPKARGFIQAKRAEGLKHRSVYHYALWLRKFDEHLNARPYADATPENIVGFLADLRANGTMPGSVDNASTYIHAALKWVLEVRELPLPLHQAFNVLNNDDIVLRDRIVADTDFDAFLASLRTLMDQTFAAVLWEAGLRISECLALNWGSFELADHDADAEGCWLLLPRDGLDLKTGPRRVHIVKHAPLVRAWLQAHARKGEKQAPAWIGDGRRNQGKRITRNRVDIRWAAAFAASNVARFTPHDLRHTAATRDAEAGYNELDLRDKYGWGAKSEMPSYYVRNRKAHREAIARRSVGLGPNGRPLPQVRPADLATCPSCAEEIKAAAVKCKHCGEFVPGKRARA